MNSAKEDSAWRSDLRRLTRREALARVAWLMGGTLIASDVFLRGAETKDTSTTLTFTPADIALMDEIGETIIPTTDTPGAKAAGVSAIMITLVTDCLDEVHQRIFREGLGKIDTLSRERFQNGFRDATPAQRTELLNNLDREQLEWKKHRLPGEPSHFFRLIKELVLLGYFTSEIGASVTLRYVEVPTKYDGNVPYKKGDRASFVATGKDLT